MNDLLLRLRNRHIFDPVKVQSRANLSEAHSDFELLSDDFIDGIGIHADGIFLLLALFFLLLFGDRFHFLFVGIVFGDFLFGPIRNVFVGIILRDFLFGPIRNFLIGGIKLL